MIEYKNVTLDYGKTNALKDVSLSLQDNKTYGLFGRNGAGKTSLLSLLAAFRKPTQGNVTVDGTSVFESAEQMERVALVWSKSYQDDPMRVSQVFDFHQAHRPNWDHEYALGLAGKFGLDLKKKTGKLSAGMQAAVNLIVGLASRAPVTIFDEAYLGLDAPHRKLFYQELLEDYMQHPRTVILSTHYISEVENLFEEIIILKEGRLLLHSTAEDFLNQGYSVSGNAPEIERFTAGKRVLNRQSLGNTHTVVIYGSIDRAEKESAEQKGLLFERPSIQDLFIYLTEGGNGHDN